MKRLTAIAAALTTAVAGALLTAPTGATADVGAIDPANAIVLPPLYGSDLPRLAIVAGSANAVAWHFNRYDDVPDQVSYVTYGGSRHDVSGSDLSNGALTLVGTQLRVGTYTRQTSYDVTTGLVTGTTSFNGNQSWGTGDGALSLVETSIPVDSYRLYKTNLAGQVTTTFDPVPIDGSSSPVDAVYVDAADPQGAIIAAWGNRGTDPVSANNPIVATLDYLDFATGDYTVLDDSVYAESSRVALSADDIVWTHAGHTYYIPRDNLTAAPADATPDTGATELAVSGDTLGYTTSVKNSAGKSVKVIKTGPLGGTDFTALSTTLPLLGPIVTADNGDFAVVAGDTVKNFGIYRLHAEGTALAGNIALFGPSAPLGIDASAGRILSVVNNAVDHPVDQSTIASTASTASVTSSSQLIDKMSVDLPPDASGGNTAYIERVPGNQYAVVLDDGDLAARYEVPGGAYRAVLSGSLLLVPYSETEAGGPGGELINLSDGETATLPEAEALYGNDVFYTAGDGLHDINVTEGTNTVVPDSSNCEGEPEDSYVQADGDWVLCDPSSNDDDNSYVGNGVVAYNVVNHTQVAVPASPDLYNQQVADTDVLLADGVVAWIDHTDRSVHVYDLATQTDTIVGTAHGAVEDHQYLALNNDFVAWVAQDDTTRVLPLGATSAAPPLYLGAISPGGFASHLKTAAGKFRPQIDTDRPLRHWTFTIKNSAGHVVHTQTGTAPLGNVRPTWNGRSPSGVKERDGTYRWSLTGGGRTGALHATNGTTKPITGTIRIDNVAPKAHASAGHVRSVAGRKVITVRLSCSDRKCGYSVYYQAAKSHSKRWSDLKLLTSDTTSTSVPLGTKAEKITLSASERYRFRVVAIDEAGNASQPVLTRATAG